MTTGGGSLQGKQYIVHDATLRMSPRQRKNTKQGEQGVVDPWMSSKSPAAQRFRVDRSRQVREHQNTISHMGHQKLAFANRKNVPLCSSSSPPARINQPKKGYVNSLPKDGKKLDETGRGLHTKTKRDSYKSGQNHKPPETRPP